MTRYGNQEGAKKGYNPAKKGGPSHHPLIAFVNDVKLVANNFLSFLEDTLSKLKNKNVSLIRLDSGFFSKEILDYLEQTNRNYIINLSKFVGLVNSALLRVNSLSILLIS